MYRAASSLSMTMNSGVGSAESTIERADAYSPDRRTWFVPRRANSRCRLFTCACSPNNVSKSCMFTVQFLYTHLYRRTYIHNVRAHVTKLGTKVQQIFEIHKDFAIKIKFIWIFLQKIVVICTNVRLSLRRGPHLWGRWSKVQQIFIFFAKKMQIFIFFMYRQPS